MGRKRVFPSVKAFEAVWERYKEQCDGNTRHVVSVSKRDGEIVHADVPAPLTYTVKGFCLFAGISEQAMYDTYGKDGRFLESLTRVRAECELDARKKFEQGYLDPKLAALWMSNYGYSTKTEAKVDSSMEAEKTKLDSILRQLEEPEQAEA